MNGADTLIQTLTNAGVEACFANPGTSEMHFVSALDNVPAMRPILTLFEGVATGAADGYGRMAGKPAATLLHLGAGLSNGLANLHNARRAATPIVNIVGDHATYHAQYDAPLASDIMGLARTVSGWVHVSNSAHSVAADAANAVAAAMEPPGQIATLILPADTAWHDADGDAPPRAVPRAPAPPPAAIERAAAALRNGKRSAILLRGHVLQEGGLQIAGRIAAASGARLLCDTFAPRLQRGAGRVPVERIPYFAEMIVDFLKDLDQLILVGAKPPVSFFAYPGKPSWCLPDHCKLVYLTQQHEDGDAALDALASALKAPVHGIESAKLERPALPTGALDQFTIGQIVGHYLPEQAILSDEAATCSLGLALGTAAAAPHDHLSLTGGSIGQGIPLATGAAIACPDRKVVCMQGDGGAMYTIQALWTQARERLDVTTIILANRAYAILNVELARVGAANTGPRALSMLDLHNPELDFVALAQGMGVEASRATTSEEFAAQFVSAMSGHGPRLIEAVI